MKWGTWLYGGLVPAEIRIVRQNYFEDGWPSKEQPLDLDGFYYILEYCLPGRALESARVSASTFASFDEALARAEATIKGVITWSSGRPN